MEHETLRTTRYSDVCGGTDELKRFLAEEPEAAHSPSGRNVVRRLVDDAEYMLARMELRLHEYQAFRDELERLTSQMREVAAPQMHDAQRASESIRALIDAGGPLPVEEIVRRAEEVRQVANDMEAALRRHKEATLAAGRAYLAARGWRGWDGGRPASTVPLAGAEPADESNRLRHGAPTGGLPAGVPEAWLPPAPHAGVIVDWLRRGRAALLSDEEVAKLPEGPQGREPWVQFEDGGVMPLRAVRWSEEVRNFYPVGAVPHPRGRLYRK